MTGFDALVVSAQIESLLVRIESAEGFWRTLPDEDRRMLAHLSHWTAEYRRELKYGLQRVKFMNEETTQPTV